MEKNNKGNIILFSVFIALVLSGFVVYRLSIKDSHENKVIVNNKYILLDDYSRFFTVNSCVYKYVQYLQSEDFDSLFKVLDNNYVINNNINESNIYNFLPNLTNKMYSFSSKKIYYEKSYGDVITYYVYGDLVEEIMDTVGNKYPYSYIVKLDTKSETFNIAPYSGNLFKGEK